MSKSTNYYNLDMLSIGEKTHLRKATYWRYHNVKNAHLMHANDLMVDKDKEIIIKKHKCQLLLLDRESL